MDTASPPNATRLGSSRGSVLDAGASGVQQLMLLEPEAPYVFSEFLGLQPSETENGVFGRLNNDYRTREGMYTFFFFAILFRGGWREGDKQSTQRVQSWRQGGENWCLSPSPVF